MRGKSSPASFESTVPCPGLRVAAVPLDEEHDQERHEDRDRGEEDGHQSPPSLDDRGPGVRAHPGSTPIAVGREPLFTEAPGRSAGSASRTTAAACSPARYPHSERHHKAGHGGRSVALIPSAPCVQTHRRVSSATPAPPATGVRLALPPKAAPEDLPPRSCRVASAPTTRSHALDWPRSSGLQSCDGQSQRCGPEAGVPGGEGALRDREVWRMRPADPEGLRVDGERQLARNTRCVSSSRVRAACRSVRIGRGCGRMTGGAHRSATPERRNYPVTRGLRNLASVPRRPS